MVAFRIGHVSITGNYRENNEDSCVDDARQRYAIVADGFGGLDLALVLEDVLVDGVHGRGRRIPAAHRRPHHTGGVPAPGGFVASC